MPKLNITCPECGSDHVRTAIWADWDVATQTYQDTGDAVENQNLHCANCNHQGWEFIWTDSETGKNAENL